MIRARLFVTALAGALALAMALVGCPTTTTTTGYTPITGIVIRSTTLVAGHGCGVGPNQVYKYAAVVSYQTAAGPSDPITSEVFDCYTDGILSNLPTSASGSAAFDVAIYAYDQASFPPDLFCPPNAATPCPGDDPATVLRFEANWTTTCSATQQQGVPVLAVCGLLEMQDAGAQQTTRGVPLLRGPEAGVTQISIDTTAFPLDEGGSIACGTTYDSANAFFMAGVQMGQTTPSPCTMPLLITPAAPNAAYSINLYLLSSGDAGPMAVASTTCSATTVPGETTAATCAPAHLGP